MQRLTLNIIYALFFLSGASALIYEVLWVRYLSLIFGGSHLAVTTVLSIFMGGLALGSYAFGKKIANKKKLLRLYGLLELGIAGSALVFAALVNIYPSIYVPLAQAAGSSPLSLTIIRVTFAAVALIVPTTLMGGTLPVLSSFVTGRIQGLGSSLSFLYGFNTIGAVVGVAASGFYLLPRYPVSTTLTIAVAINVLVGILGVVLQDRAQEVLDAAAAGEEPVAGSGMPDALVQVQPENLASFRLVLWGIGFSGFCALAYEVLWTRILSIVIGASVYGFALLLMAFLAGIGLGSAAYGLFVRVSGTERKAPEGSCMRSIVGFGLVQVLIGVSALIVTLYIRELPTLTLRIHDFFHAMHLKIAPFKTRQLSNFFLAFSFMFVPAFFMGVAFPLAGKIHGQYKKLVGRAVGEVLSYNTIGAILGSAVSGFALIYLLGIQRSIQVIILVNIGFGLLVMTSVRGRRTLNWGIAGAVAAVALLLVVKPDLWRLWDPKFYAIYQSNLIEKYRSPEAVRDALANNDVLYYGEGIQATVSSIQSGERRYFITNGRVEASNSNEGRQCQYTLGHLPMLLNKDPKSVFVLGTGSGMTLGATSVHPSVERITLAEIEPKVLGVARTFGIYNHYVLNNPKVRIVFNDGRNFLMTTKEKFDVITADPIHPWFSGAGYLYSVEYFRLASEHLNPGGMVCQWLPIYELTEENLKSVVRTLREVFPYVMVWLTHDDAELIGSNAPIVIDEKDLERRIRVPEIQQDLVPVRMASAEDFLSYFVMGNEGAKAYSMGGRINTDDNLYLEFSAPHSIGKAHLMGTNVYDLVRHRESILPYLVTPADEAGRAKQRTTWERNSKAAMLNDQAHVMNLAGRYTAPEYEKLAAELDARHAGYAPWKFLREERHEEQRGGTPRLLRQVEFSLLNQRGEVIQLQLSAVMLRRNEERARVFFIDNASRIVFGKVRVRGTGKDAAVAAFVDGLFKDVQALYDEEPKQSAAPGKTFPRATTLLPKIRHLVEVRTDEAKI
jgi:spermidine synthase